LQIKLLPITLACGVDNASNLYNNTIVEAMLHKVSVVIRTTKVI